MYNKSIQDESLRKEFYKSIPRVLYILDTNNLYNLI